MSKSTSGPLGFSVGQWRLFMVVLVVGLSLTTFQIFRRQGLSDTAALYIGLPLLLALAMSLSPKSQSTIGATMKGLTIALLLSVPVFMEGFICVLFASPILYSIAALTAWCADRLKKSRDGRSTLQFSVIASVLFVASLEGTPYELISFDDHYEVTYSDVVTGSVDSIKGKLAAFAFSANHRPAFLKVFPYPESVSSEGLEAGDEISVRFVYKKWFIANAHSGTTVFRVVESNDNIIRFEIPTDDSYLSHYLDWQASEVSFSPVNEAETRVAWTLSFRRKLDPAWYFGPLQRYAAWLAAQVLVSNVAA